MVSDKSSLTYICSTTCHWLVMPLFGFKVREHFPNFWLLTMCCLSSSYFAFVLWTTASEKQSFTYIPHNTSLGAGFEQNINNVPLDRCWLFSEMNHTQVDKPHLFRWFVYLSCTTTNQWQSWWCILGALVCAIFPVLLALVHVHIWLHKYPGTYQCCAQYVALFNVCPHVWFHVCVYMHVYICAHVCINALSTHIAHKTDMIKHMCI